MSDNLFSHHPGRNKKYQAFFNRAMTVGAMIRLIDRLLRQAHCHHHFFGTTLTKTAEYLTFFCLKLPIDSRYFSMTLTRDKALEIIALSERRIAERVPVEYLTQEAIYCDHTFYVNQHVLVPRSVMSTRFDDFLQGLTAEHPRILDLCTGSGCIGITLALKNPTLSVDLVDISADALTVALINIKKHGLENRVRCIQSDLFSNVSDKYDLIITNPPYVSESEYQYVPKEFKKEPKLALTSGWDGLEIIHQIVARAKNYLTPNGKLIAEVGYASARRLKRRYDKHQFTWLPYRKPSGKISLLAMDCLFIINATDLPATLRQRHQQRRWFRIIDKIKDYF